MFNDWELNPRRNPAWTATPTLLFNYTYALAMIDRQDGDTSLMSK